jgi:DHA2 family multidrug resistance protein-like MFS transporter
MSSPTPERWRVLAVVCAALSVVVIDVTVLHVAAPSITEDLQPSAIGLLWIIDVYPLVVAPLLVATGTLGDRIGRKRMLLYGMVVFGIASAISAFAPTTGVLIAARALMGVGGAMITPSTMSIVRDVFEDREERVKAVGIWSATLAGGAAAGPLIGGVLVEHFWWGSVFLVNVPLLLIVFPIALRVLPESRAQEPPPWDLTSVVLVGFGVLGLAFGIKEGARHGFGEPWIAATLVASVVLLAAFTRRQLRRPDPLLDMRLFSERVFAVAVGCVLLSMFALVGLELFFAQYLQLVLGLGPLEAGLWTAPSGGAFIVGSLVAPALLRWLHKVDVMASGLAISAVGAFVLSRLGGTPSLAILETGYLLFGFGLSLTFTHAVDVVVASAPPERAGSASAIAETGAELGGAVGIAILGSIINALSDDAMARIAEPGAALDFARAMGVTATICALALLAAAVAAWRLIPRR